MVGLKMHYSDLGDNIKKEIMGIPNLPGASDTSNDKKFDEEYKFLAGEGKKLKTYVPKIEKLEKELELLDQASNGEDAELRSLPETFA
mgnify:CR=1 FL=1